MSTSIIPPDLAAAIRPHLHADEKIEKILWVGRPPQGAFRWPCYNGNVKALAFTALMLALSPLLILVDPKMASIEAVWVSLAGLVAFPIILKGDAEWRIRTVYAITNIRALSCRADGRGSASSVPIPNQVRIERERQGRATLFIGETPQATMTIGIWNFGTENQIVFRSIEDGSSAYALARGGYWAPFEPD
jgi:hypothetical protein